jgi:superfamily II DNA or RNA helicase
VTATLKKGISVSNLIQSGVNAITLRGWQKEAVKVLSKSVRNNRLGVIEACPGAGKTLLGVYLSGQLYLEGFINTVVVLAPSILVKEGWVGDATKMGFVASSESINFTTDVNFRAVTYAGYIKALSEVKPGCKYLLLCDEYHHGERDAAWGQAIEELHHGAAGTIMLSGTPWRTVGEIPLLKEGGYYVDGVVKPDYCYSYAQDLAAGGNDRGTVPVRFEAFESEAVKKSQSGEIEVVSEFEKPESDEDWKAIAEIEAQEPTRDSLSPHISVSDSRISNNSTIRHMLSRAMMHMESARNEGKIPYAITLVVTRSIREAKHIASYIETALHYKAEVIASDDAKACNRIKDIKDEIKKATGLRRTPNIPDVIVSIGMISEGVNIPPIKTIVYASPITTQLYLVQVFARAMRRVEVSPGTWADPEMSWETAAKVMIIAHPAIVKLAYEIESVAREALKERQPKDPESPEIDPPKDESELDEFVANSSGEFSAIYREQHIDLKYESMVDELASVPEVSDPYLGPLTFKSWAQTAWRNDHESAYGRIVELYSVYGEKVVKPSPIPVMTDLPIQTYDEKAASIRSETKTLASRLRFHYGFFKNIEDDEAAYRAVYKAVNKRIGIKKLSGQSLEVKAKWIDAAKEMLSEAGVRA